MKKLLLLSLVILLSGCNKDDIDSLNQQIASLTKKIADDAAVSDQKLAVAISGFDTSLNTIKDKDVTINVISKSGKIHSPKFLLSEYKGNTVPFRTFGGGNYLNGYSDHFPVSIKVEF